MKSIWINALTVFLLLIGLPLIGVGLSGKPLPRYAQFPPLTRYVEHAPFSMSVFVTLSVFIMAVVGPFAFHVLSQRGRVKPLPSPRYPFPWWGWAGFVLGSAAWILAWTRFPWFAPWQQHTFFPLWLAYILVVNALTYYRTGQCLLSHRTQYYLLLFPLSAVFWWFFEYLNRFVQNWYYQGIQHMSPLEYVVFATLPFSTVFPAVMGTYELLRSFPVLYRGLERCYPFRFFAPKTAAWLMLSASSAGLAGIGIWPDLLFPLLWVSPLLVLTSIQVFAEKPTIFTDIMYGDWRRVYLLALSALVCGVIWEMWNYYSLAKWIYTIPYVNRFHVFEMPILGYAGYLPFGLECGVIALMLERSLSGKQSD